MESLTYGPLTYERIEFNRQWVKMLRSGEYQQARNQLRDGDKFCCLGVACDLIDPNKWNGNAYIRSTAIPPFDFFKKFLTNPRRYSTLNDGGYTFAAIADVIERDLYNY